MCIVCAEWGKRPSFGRKEALATLALLESEAASDPHAALRLGALLLDWTESEASNYRCDDPTAVPLFDLFENKPA